MKNKKLSSFLSALSGPPLYKMLTLTCISLLLILLSADNLQAATKTSISSGNWDNALIWQPAGVPSPNDNVIIDNNSNVTVNSQRQVNNLTVSTNSLLVFLPEMSLTMTGNLTVNGKLDMNGGNLIPASSGLEFNLGPASFFTWCPGNNTASGSSLFLKSKENFNPTSSLIIRKWYDYSVPLGELVTGNFGNLTLNSTNDSNLIIEWNQKNKFESHLILGALTIDQGWVTLDKSGAISSTTIGQIFLTSVNSTFIAHNGSHPSSFSLTTNTVTNNGGKFFGLNDGNGDITLNVHGNFYNNGNVKIINNSGIPAVSNGNAFLKIDGDFIQNCGDTRILYNIATLNSGYFNADFKNLILKGGIFMGQSACHTNGKTNSINIENNLIINFNNPADKFRGNGISSIGQTVNNSRLSLNVGGNVEISGTENAEVTGSASAGTEIVNITGDFSVKGCTTNFNYGTSSAAHTTQILISGNMRVLGGITTLSKNSGQLNCFIGQTINISSGTCKIKGNSGPATLVLNGNYIQNGGELLLHSNSTVPTADVVRMEVNGNFELNGGKINYDNNSIGAQHIITLKGDVCRLSGNGILTRSGNGTSGFFGFLNYEKQGKITYERTGNPQVEQVIQSVNRNCELFVDRNTLLISSHTSANYTTLKVYPGGKIFLRNATIASNNQFPFSALNVDSAGTIALNNDEGFYGRNGAAIDASVNYSLHKESIVEYCGTRKQYVTGNPAQSSQPDKNYGILRIKSDKKIFYARLVDNVLVRTRFELEKGILQLNNNTFTLSNGKPEGIRRTSGVIEGEWNDATSGSMFIWKNIQSGRHEIPFGKSPTEYLPVCITPTGGLGSDISIYTHLISGSENPVLNFRTQTSDAKFNLVSNPVKRCWTISAPGLTADVSFTFDENENAQNTDWALSTYKLLQWSGTTWVTLANTNQQRNNDSRIITLNNCNSWSDFILIPDSNLLQFKLASFEVIPKDEETLLSWEALNEKEDESYTIEKSTDGINFYPIGELQKTERTENKKYRFSDKETKDVVCYYRIVSGSNTANKTYSETRTLNKLKKNSESGGVSLSVNPNPFTGNITVGFISREEVTLQITDAEGKNVFNQKESSTGGELSPLNLDLSFLKKGIYFLTVSGNGKKESKKIIKNE